MKNVEFTYHGNVSVFQYQNEIGETDYFEYKIGVSEDFNISICKDYEVELLINPVLSREIHHFSLCRRDGDDRISFGIVFPISMLDGTEEEISSKQKDYFAIAFYELLRRLERIEDGLFSQNFEDNICVCVFNLNQAQSGVNILSKCIHSLRLYNYSYFTNNNTYAPIDKYLESWFISENQRNIVVSLQEPPLYKEKMIDTIMRILPNVNNVIHRFFLLYQVIEFLIARIQKQDIGEQIFKYKRGNIPENDFFEKIAHIKREGTIIKEIFEKCSLETNDYNRFVSEV